MKPGRHERTNRWQRSRGVALVATLLLLSLFTVMTLAMVIATMSDTLIDGYYKNFRGSFYAADSGLNSARQYIVNQFQNTALPTGWTPSSGVPFSTGTDTTIYNNLTNTSTGFGSYVSTVGSQSSWPGSFIVDTTNAGTSTAHTYVAGSLHPPTCTPTYTGGTSSTETCTQAAADSTAKVTQYLYAYPYQVTVIGQSRSNEQNTVVENGTVNIAIPISTTTGTTSSFSAYGTFFNTYGICTSPFVTGTMTGPFFSNDSWNFGDSGLVGNGAYIFTNSVGAHSSNVGYMYSDGTCHQVDATSDSESVTTSQTTTTGSGRNRKTVTTYTTTTTTITPQFQGGLNLGQATVPLPADSYNQEVAAINGLGGCGAASGSSNSCPAPTSTQLQTLQTAGGTAWPSSGSAPTSGVYFPYATVAGVKTYKGGGLIVQGNADSILLQAGGTTSAPTQIIQIKQGSVTTTVTINPNTNQTTITDTTGANTVITGVPENLNNSPASEACMVYVNGAISGTSGSGYGATTTGLSGPSSGAAIASNSAVTVAATGNIAITGSITYASEPVTMSQQGSVAADTLITPTPSNVLGIFTTTGDIQLQPTSNVSTMEIDASLAAISSGGSGGLIAQWNTIGTLNIVGGRIANQAKSGASIGSRNIWFDQRFAQGGFAPPWFPATTLGSSSTATVGTPVVTVSRVSWQNTSN